MRQRHLLCLGWLAWIVIGAGCSDETPTPGADAGTDTGVAGDGSTKPDKNTAKIEAGTVEQGTVDRGPASETSVPDAAQGEGGVSPDRGTTTDVGAAPDGAGQVDASASADASTPADQGSRDSAAVADRAVLVDRSVAPDRTAKPDLAAVPDLATLPDLATVPDLPQVADAAGDIPQDLPQPVDLAGDIPQDQPQPVDLAGDIPQDQPQPVDLAGDIPQDQPQPVDLAGDQGQLADSSGDAPQVQDGGAPAFDGAPPLVDAAPLPDGMFAFDGLLADGSAPQDLMVGQTEAGQKYLCRSASGSAVLCACNDGADNDNDNKVDFSGGDPGCTGPWDNSENNQCSNGVDDDGDGLIDARDPGCTGPLDNDESSFGTNIPGDNQDPCREDCFFDGDSGQGNDKCMWHLRCDPLNPGYYLNGKCIFDPTYKNPKLSTCQGYQASQDPTCLNVCLRITPNGCDCFGCCQLTNGTTTVVAKLSPSCTLNDLGDPTKCVRCTQVKACLNTCGPCEVCIGKPKPEPWCFPQDGGPGPSDAGVVYSEGPVPLIDGSLPLSDAGTPVTDLTYSEAPVPLGDSAVTPSDASVTFSEGPVPLVDGSIPLTDAGTPVTDLTYSEGSVPLVDAGSPTDPCPPGVTYCGPGGVNSCPVGTYCLTGCCIFY